MKEADRYVKEYTKWNPVLDKVLEIKQLYQNRFNDIDYSECEEGTCFEKWVHKLGNEKYEEFIKPLHIRQFGTLLLICYKNFNKINKIRGINPRILWDMLDGIYRECRGVVIDIEKEELVLTPYRKFFNIDDREETSLDAVVDRIKTAKCVEFSEKLDGSMISARWWDSNLMLATSNSINPSSSWRLKDAYKRMNSSRNHISMLKDYPDYTFIFELITMQDAHIVKYDVEQENLYLTGIRNVFTGKELSYNEVLSIADTYDVPHVKIYNTNLDEVMSELDDKEADEAEGYVLNIDGYKIKIKYNDYVLIHKSLGQIQSAKYIIRVISDGNFDDYISKVPYTYRDLVMNKVDFIFKYIDEVSKLTKKYYNEAPKTDRKTFMMWLDENVPKFMTPFCRRMYLYPDEELNYLTNGRLVQPSYYDLDFMLNFFNYYNIPVDTTYIYATQPNEGVSGDNDDDNNDIDDI